LKIDMSFSSAEGGPIWITFRRLVQNEMSTVVIWSKSKPDVEFQYGGRLGEFQGMSSQSHVSHCRVLPLGEFTVMIPEPHATLQGAVTWRNQCLDCATFQGVIIPPVILKIVFCHNFFWFFTAVWALTSGSFRIVSDTLVSFDTSAMCDRQTDIPLMSMLRCSVAERYKNYLHLSYAIDF